MSDYNHLDVAVNLKKSPINAISFSKRLNFVAVGRESGTIEIYDLSQNFLFISKIIVSNTNPIDAIKFMTFNGEEKLFGISSAKLFEIDLSKNYVKQEIFFMNSQCARCIIEANNKIVVGCESGYINIYDYISEIMNCQTIHNTQEPVFSLAYNQQFNNFLFSASQKRLYRINMSTKNTDFFDLPKERSRAHAIIWCMEFVGKFLCTGDSKGMITIWNAECFGIIKTFTTHKADILSITVGVNCFYASGLDPNIVKIELIGDTWSETSKYFGQTGDIRSLCLANSQLIVGGLNCNLSIYDMGTNKSELKDKFTTIDNVPELLEIHPFPINESHILFIQSMKSIKIMEIQSKPLRRTVLRTVKAYKDSHIQAWSASTSLQYLAYSTNTETRVLKMRMSVLNGTASLDLKRYNAPHFQEQSIKAEGQGVHLPPSYLLKFVDVDSKLYLILAESCVASRKSDNKSKILIYEIIESAYAPILKVTILTQEENVYNQVHRLEISENGHLMAFATLDSKLFIYSLSKLKMVKKICPQDSGVSTSVSCNDFPRVLCMKFKPGKDNLIVIYSNRKILDMDLYRRMSSKWTNEFNAHARKEWLNVTPRMIYFLDEKKIAILVDRRIIVQIDMTKPPVIPLNVPLFLKKRSAKSVNKRTLNIEIVKQQKLFGKMDKIIKFLKQRNDLGAVKNYEKRKLKHQKRIDQLKNLEVDVNRETCFTWNFFKHNTIGFKYISDNQMFITVSLEEKSQSSTTYRKKVFGI